MAISTCHQLCALGRVCTVHANTSKHIYARTRQLTSRTIQQQILTQTLFRPEFTRNDQGLFKSSSHIFLNHLISSFSNNQSAFIKSCSCKSQQNVAGGSIIKNHKNLYFKLTFSNIIKYFILKHITNLLTSTNMYF